MAVEMSVKGLMMDPVTQMPIIVLRDRAGDTVLPIWVGLFEANAIAMQLEKVVPPRPYTHDLLRSMLETLKARVERNVITDLKDNTFIALINLEMNGERMANDDRELRKLQQLRGQHLQRIVAGCVKCAAQKQVFGGIAG